ncbi:hypothetical protein BDC45DRAFT_510356 [Circinella umbellata]|nr:hypothetical protein BDC45DRAFT_510356 [Circinella umbellata]
MTTPPPLSQQQQQSEPIINTKPNHVVSWQNELSEFFNGIGLTETSQCFNTELIVLSRHYLERLPIELEKLVERLLQSLEQHVQAKEEQESKQQQQLQKSNNNNNDLNDQQEQQQKEKEKQQLSTESNNNTIVSKLLYNNKKRKRPEGEEEEEKEKEEQERVQSMDSEKVQIRATNNEIQQRIQTFIQAKQTEVDESNRTEFLNRVDPTSSDVTCARADAREINRNIQMKFDIVNNEDGPLARSLISSSTNNNNNNNNHEKISTTETILNERIQNIEQHLNVSFDNQAIPPFSLHERIKILENVLMDIEREHPKWAAIHFQQPNRKFPPAPPITYIMRPDGSKGEYITTQQVPQPPPTIPGHPHMKTTGRANSSLTRAVLEQLNRKRQQQAIVESSSTSSSSSPIINNIHSIPSSSSSTSPTL